LTLLTLLTMLITRLVVQSLLTLHTYSPAYPTLGNAGFPVAELVNVWHQLATGSALMLEKLRNLEARY
jgi:hypothetical protein